MYTNETIEYLALGPAVTHEPGPRLHRTQQGPPTVGESHGAANLHQQSKKLARTQIYQQPRLLAAHALSRARRVARTPIEQNPRADLRGRHFIIVVAVET